MKIFITGASGFVGAAVAVQAVYAGHEVVACVRPESSLARLSDILPSIRVVRCSSQDIEPFAAIMRKCKPDAIVHAAWAGVSNSKRKEHLQVIDNVESSWRLAGMAAAAGVQKFVGIGSQAEYGGLLNKVNETRLPEPSSLYGAAKLAVLNLTRQTAIQSGISFAWLRLFSAYGPHDNPWWLIPSVIESLLGNTRPKTSLGVQLWDYLFIDDVARGILDVVVSQEALGVFNLGSGKAIAVRAIVEMARDLINPDIDLVFGDIDYPPDQIWHLEADITRITEQTGWRPAIDLMTGLKMTIKWHRERNLLREARHRSPDR